MYLFGVRDIWLGVFPKMICSGPRGRLHCNTRLISSPTLAQKCCTYCVQNICAWWALSSPQWCQHLAVMSLLYFDWINGVLKYCIWNFQENFFQSRELVVFQVLLHISVQSSSVMFIFSLFSQVVSTLSLSPSPLPLMICIYVQLNT